MEPWTLIEGDCMDVLPGIGGVTHVICDPPYSEHTHSKPWQSKALANGGDSRAASEHGGIDFASLTNDQAFQVAEWAAGHVERWSIVFCDLEGIQTWREAIRATAMDYVRTCIWDKVDSCPQFTGDRPASAAEAFVCAHRKGRKRWNGGGRRNVFSFPVNAERGSKPHPTTKPLALMLTIVELFTSPGDLVVDPFAGSGTTGVACLRLGRPVIMIEKDPKYAAVARERMRAEEQGLTLRQLRAGQTTLFGA